MEKRMNETQTQTPTAQAVSPVALDLDMSLEYDSMVLLSKLEQLVIQLGEKTVQASTTLALEYLAEMVNDMVEFFEHPPVATVRRLPLDTLLTKDLKNYTLLQPQYVTNNRLNLKLMTEQGMLKQPQMFQRLSNDILRIINIYLSLNVKAFQTPRMIEQWRTLYAGLLKHLVKALREIQAN
jgi:hypothetical protein